MGKQKSEAAGAPAWMAIFSDLMTQILVFFIILFTMSSVSDDKFQELIISFNGALGSFVTDDQLMGQRYQEAEDGTYQPSSAEEKEMKDMLEEMSGFVNMEKLSDEITVEQSEEGMKISLSDKVLFPSGQAKFHPDAIMILRGVGKIIKRLPNKIRIEGHTDNVPIKTAEYPSNWELSTARASVVGRFFMEDLKMKPDRFSLAGYGEYRNVVPNNTNRNRQRNRRVDIVVLK